MRKNEELWWELGETDEKKYRGSVHPLFIEDYPNGLRFCADRLRLLYEFPNGYAIYQIIGRKRYELKEIIGSVPEELLKGLDHDANHRAWISRTYNAKTPFLIFDKRKKYRLKRAWNGFILKLTDLKIIHPEKTKSWMIPIR